MGVEMLSISRELARKYQSLIMSLTCICVYDSGAAYYNSHTDSGEVYRDSSRGYIMDVLEEDVCKSAWRW